MSPTPATDALATVVPIEMVEIRPGRRIAVHQRGSPNQDTVLLVHGSMATMLQWTAQIEALASKGHRVVAYDWLGMGRAEKPDGWEVYSPAEHFADLLAVVAKFCAGPGKLHVFGHSAGCSLALRLAAAAKGTSGDLPPVGEPPPKAPTSLVLVSPPLTFGVPAWLFRLPSFVLEWMRPGLDQNFIAAAMHPKTREAATPEHQRLTAFAAENCRNNPFHVVKPYYRQFAVPSPEVVSAALSGREQSVLFVCGADDLITPSAAHAIPMRAAHLGSTSREVLLVPEASHQVMEEKPEAVNAAVLAFLADVSGSGGGGGILPRLW
jgi:abhydrolase domain-containing protein 8